MGLTGMVFVRGYSCRAKPGSCRGACREPKVGMARRRLTKVDGAGMSNGSRIACNSTFKSKRRRAVPAAKPLGKPPRFVVARSAPVHKQLVCSHVAAEWHCAGLARQISGRNLWFSKNAIFHFDGAAVIVLYCSNTCKTSFRQDYRIIRIMKSPKTLAHCKNLVNPVNPV